MRSAQRTGMSERPSPWNLGGLTVGELGRRVWAEIGDDEVTDRAAALAYYFLFALFPTLLFLTVLLGLLPLPGLMDRLLQYGDQALPGDAASIVRRTWIEINRGASGGLLSIGVLTALWASSNGMASIMSALNVAYDVEDNRSWWKRRLLAVLLTFGFALFILAALIMLVFGPHIGAGVAGALRSRHDLHVDLGHRQHPDRDVLRARGHCPRLLPGARGGAALALGDAGLRRGPGVVAGDVVGVAPLRRAVRRLQRHLRLHRRHRPAWCCGCTSRAWCCSSEPKSMPRSSTRPPAAARSPPRPPARSAHRRTRSPRTAPGPCPAGR